MHDFSQGPSSNSHGSVQHCHRDSSASLYCNFRGFVLHFQHDSFPDPSCNFRGFVHDLSQGPSSNSHGSVQHYHRDSSASLSCNFRGFVLRAGLLLQLLSGSVGLGS